MAEAHNTHRHVLAWVHSARQIFLELRQERRKRSLSNIFLCRFYPQPLSCTSLLQLLLRHSVTIAMKHPFVPNMADAIYLSGGFIKKCVRRHCESVKLLVGGADFYSTAVRRKGEPRAATRARRNTTRSRYRLPQWFSLINPWTRVPLVLPLKCQRPAAAQAKLRPEKNINIRVWWGLWGWGVAGHNSTINNPRTSVTPENHHRVPSFVHLRLPFPLSFPGLSHACVCCLATSSVPERDIPLGVSSHAHAQPPQTVPAMRGILAAQGRAPSRR